MMLQVWILVKATFSYCSLEEIPRRSFSSCLLVSLDIYIEVLTLPRHLAAHILA